MNGLWKKISVFLVVLVLLASFGFTCGKEGGGGKVRITIGLITDMSGPASPMLLPGNDAIYDSARHINEDDPIPGAQINIVTYDGRLDPSRDIPGYDWLRERGANLIITCATSSGDVLKDFAARDRVVIYSLSTSLYQMDPPGWVFGATPPTAWAIKGFLRWISENWNYETQGRKPKIGSAGWDDPYDMEVAKAMKEYAEDHPGKFDYIGSYLAPVSTWIWAGEVEALKGCDYVCLPSTGMGTATFAEQFRDKGYAATFIGLDAMGAFLHVLVEQCGWPCLDGSITALAGLYWSDDFPMVHECKDLLDRYRPKEKQAIMKVGLGYVSIFSCAQFIFGLLRQALQDVGVANLDGQAIYNSAVKFHWYTEGLPETGYGFTESRRYAVEHMAIYEWRAEKEDLVRISNWLPILVE